MTAARRRDPAKEAEAYSSAMTLTELPEETYAAARHYIGRRARDKADEQLLLEALNLHQPA
ncbi:hypothetical protein [Kitasatospora cathayae]|uniref:Uncharacterized protein n=1 Tax=Kitasatospora cathayae TaxID=3004092 RepID=A0ABY7Q9S9_9ACTN|nr:hypothetical protein [Kitasatospora sp. HUAS 3-15]WBP89485.1 hypothetical protein O1G21_29040 [Kitasatospora sp. HUAS 3-15]